MGYEYNKQNTREQGKQVAFTLYLNMKKTNTKKTKQTSHIPNKTHLRTLIKHF